MTFKLSGNVHISGKTLLNLNDAIIFSPFLFNIGNSSVFNDNDTTVMTNTFGVPTDSNVWTFSTWVKRGNITGGFQSIFTDSSNVSTGGLYFNTDDRLRLVRSPGVDLITSAIYRDTTAWYHIVVAYNSDEVTVSDRVNIWVNGNLITDFSLETYPALGTDFGVLNTNGNPHQLGRNTVSNPFLLDGYLSETIFVDGQALNATDFGQFDITTGIWTPINYSGTYGNNGFRLNYSDSANLGNDISGNNNDWTEFNFTAANQTNDSPTNNHCTLHSQGPNSPVSYEFGNLKAGATNPSLGGLIAGTFATRTGKWYYEVTINFPGGTGFPWLGWAQMPFNSGLSGSQARLGDATFSSTASRGFSYGGDGVVRDHFTNTPGGTTYTTNDVVSVAVDFDIGNAWVAVNGVWESGDPALGTNPSFTGIVVGDTYTPAATLFGTGTNIDFNFGQKAFVHTLPSGFQRLSALNLQAPTFNDPSTVLRPLFYAGDGISPRALTGFKFQPDWIFIDNRTTGSSSPQIFDSIRGPAQTLYPNINNVETPNNIAGYVSAFNANGFEVTSGSTNDDAVNDAAINYTSVSLKQDPNFFDVVAYTGTGAVQNVPHNLNKKPNWIWVKSRDAVRNWFAYADPFPINGVPSNNPGQFAYLLNGTTSAVSDSTVWNNTDATDSVFTVGAGAGVSALNEEFIAYLFASTPGVCDIGIYRPNLSANGPVIYTGFRPAVVLLRLMDSAGTLFGIYHNGEAGYNPINFRTLLNSSIADQSGLTIDYLSTGFKIRTTDGNVNTTSGGNFDYIYMALAEFPANWGTAF